MSEEIVFIACSAPLASESIEMTHDSGDHSVSMMSLNNIEGETELSTFLSRRVFVHSAEWAVGTPFSYTLKPFDVYFADSDIQAKIAGYSLFRCDFEVEIFVKGTKYHGGMLMASVRRYGHENTRAVFAGDQQLVSYSQRPHVFIEAGASQSSTITVPFVYPAGWWDLSNVNFDTMPPPNTATVFISSFGTLLALTSATSPVEISIYLRATNVQYAAPTKYNFVGTSEEITFIACAKEKKKSKKTMHRTDEYQEPIQVSGVASALASAAGMLGTVPVIGPFALATEIGLNAVSGIARLFGYSRPAIIDNVTVTRPTAVGNLALTDGGDPVQKLTLTSKQEVTVDPRTLGLPPVDEMSLDFLVKKESYLTSFEWDPATGTNTPIFHIKVVPDAHRSYADDRYMTSIGFASQHFKFWSGTVRFRFMIVGTSFHTGKLAFVYEPAQPGLPSTTDRYTRLNYEILDIESERDISLDVRWAQSAPYKPLTNLGWDESDYFTLGTYDSTITNFSNGAITVYPFTGLVSPDNVTKVRVLVFISGGDDFELHNPGEMPQYASPFPAWTAASDETFIATADEEPLSPGAMEFAEEQTAPPIVMGGSVNDRDEKALVHWGERPTSLRQLMKRYQYYRTVHVAGAANTEYKWDWHMFPAAYGKAPNGNWDTSAQVSGTSFTFVGVTTFQTIGRAYGMWRGAIRYKYIPLNGYATYRVNRHPDDTAESPNAGTQASGASSAKATRQDLELAYNALGGTAFSQRQVNPVLEFEMPYYSPLRAQDVNHTFRGLEGVTGRNSGEIFHTRVYGAGSNHLTATYVAAGDDFSFFCFNGAGTVSWQQNAPTASN